jgi:hypothetical protein
MCRVPARTKDTTTSAVVVVSPVRVLRPQERVRRSGISSRETGPSVRDLAPRTARRPRQCRRPGRCATPNKAAPPSRPGFALGPQCHAAPGPGEIADAGGSPQLARRPPTRRWPTSLRIPGNHSLCGRRPRMRAQDDAHQSGLAAATRPLPLVNTEAVRTPVTAPACPRASVSRARPSPPASRSEQKRGARSTDPRTYPERVSVAGSEDARIASLRQPRGCNWRAPVGIGPSR